MPGGILWLASYPKSGNTWIRIFLENLFRNAPAPVPINDLGVVSLSDAAPHLYQALSASPVAALSDADLYPLRRRLQQRFASRPETSIVKTHNQIFGADGNPLIHLEFTMGAIYVVRNIFDVTVSFADHYGLAIDDAVEGISQPSMATPTTRSAVCQYLGRWSDHYRSWTGVGGFEPLVIRYEDLRGNPFKTFSRIVKFLGLQSPKERIKRAIRFSSFAEVSRQEKTQGFKERVRADQVFFRRGTVGGWRQHLSEGHVQRLVESHGDVLRELRYIDAEGNPTV